MRSLPELDGLIAATHSPFDANGALDVSTVPKQAALFREMDLIGVFVGGSTGEWFALTVEERQALTEAWVEAAGADLVVIAHVGGIEIEAAQRLAAHAERAGVSAISCLVQPHTGDGTATAAVDYLEAVASAAPETSAFYYDMQSVTGVDVPLDVLLSTAVERVPTLAGAKYTGGDLATLARARRVSDDLQILMGRDEMLLDALATGVTGAVGSTYNYAAPVYQRIRAAMATGDSEAAGRANVEVAQFIEVLLDVGVLPGAKAIMKWMGVDVGSPRPPNDTLTPERAASFHAAIKDMDIFARPLRP
jgi:N-acetylneuraminate lyase